MTKTTPSNRLPRFRRAPRRAPRMQLTDRDREVLYDLYHYRFLPTSLVIERRFGSATRGRARLKLLYHHSYVDRTFLPTTGPAMGEAIYSLGPAAVAELVTFYGLEPADIQRRRARVEPFFIAHELLISRFRIRLAAAGAPYGVGIRDWRDDFEIRAAGSRLIPDGVGWVQTKRARFAFCLEADRGTMTVGRVGKKFDRYRAAQSAAALKKPIGAARFRVLVIAPTEQRLASLKAAAERSGVRNVWLTTEPALADDLVLGRVWRRAGHKERFPLLKEAQVFTDTTTTERRTE